ncbi:hypothetical protein HMN09_00002100 [Mycena chlorophos]|uniref:Uncharacterized protein n=1 Tax=Mycena chlorophos TaxID=658473 RepID=A0A8H6TSG0_MYCCL|nr:hypothetical protein HMN09_00002100 [Mycena chlorophos]
MFPTGSRSRNPILPSKFPPHAPTRSSVSPKQSSNTLRYPKPTTIGFCVWRSTRSRLTLMDIRIPDAISWTISVRLERCSHVTGPLQYGSLSITYADIKQAPSISNLAAMIAAVDSTSLTCNSGMGTNPGACFNRGLAIVLLYQANVAGRPAPGTSTNILEPSGWTMALAALRIPKHIPREDCLAHLGKIYDEQLVHINRLRELYHATPDAVQRFRADSETSTLIPQHDENKALLEDLHSKIAENLARLEKLEAMLPAQVQVGVTDMSPEYSKVDSELR